MNLKHIIAIMIGIVAVTMFMVGQAVLSGGSQTAQQLAPEIIADRTAPSARNDPMVPVTIDEASRRATLHNEVTDVRTNTAQAYVAPPVVTDIRNSDGDDDLTRTLFDGNAEFITTPEPTVVEVEPEPVVVEPEPQNAAPITKADRVITGHGARVRMDVLSNDTDPDGDEIELTDVSYDGRTAEVEIVENFVVVTPSLSSQNARVEEITYTITDTNGGSATGTLFVDVEAYIPEIVEEPEPTPVAVVDPLNLYMDVMRDQLTLTLTQQEPDYGVVEVAPEIEAN